MLKSPEQNREIEKRDLLALGKTEQEAKNTLQIKEALKKSEGDEVLVESGELRIGSEALEKIKRDNKEDLLKIERYARLKQEFNRQIDNFMKKGFPKLAGMDEEKFALIFEPLKEQLKELSGREFKEGRIPFVIVPREKLLSLEKKILLMEDNGKRGFTELDLSKFKTMEGIEIPESMAYLAVDIEDGTAMNAKSPDEAVKRFQKEDRSPLTAEEGVALVFQHPEILLGHLMHISGSRYDDDTKVALLSFDWMDGPKLSWDYSNHSSGAFWGSASCGSRVGV